MRSRLGYTIGLLAAAALTLGAAGCDLKQSGDENVVAGKEAFIEKCGRCHILARAGQGARGVVGPNLDEAFQQARRSGMKSSTIQGVTYEQILYPNINKQDTGAFMPAKLATGQEADDIAAYVGQVAGKPGKDTGPLAAVGQVQQKELAVAKRGVLDIPAAPQGLLYAFKNAEAEAGALTINSKNDQTTPHNIAVQGNGVDEVGAVITGGQTSTVEVDVQAGEYPFLCTVPGHAQAGMKGVLTVK